MEKVEWLNKVIPFKIAAVFLIKEWCVSVCVRVCVSVKQIASVS